MTQLIEQLKRHEGYRKHQYADTVGLMTIGYGYCLSHNPLRLSDEKLKRITENGISKEEAEEILNQCVIQTHNKLALTLSFFTALSTVRQECLVNMAFNIGVAGLMEFKHMNFCLRAGDYEGAAREMRDSKWAFQVKGRAAELAEQMRSGEY